MFKITPKSRVHFLRSHKAAVFALFGVFVLLATPVFLYAYTRVSALKRVGSLVGWFAGAFTGLVALPAHQRTSSRRASLFVGLLLTIVTGMTLFSLIPVKPAHAVSANDTVNFQARLESNTGAIANDGNYNVQFKLYDASTGGTNLWTETRTGSDKVRVQNGYLTVNLGSVTAFPSTINWAQKLYLTMNIGGTGTTPTYDGEMNPRLQLTATPYAFTAGSLAAVNPVTGFKSSLNFQGATGGDQSLNIPDLTHAGTDVVCLQSLANCTGTGGGIAGAGTQYYLSVFDTAGGNHIGATSGNGALYDDGSFLGLGTSTNSGLLSIMGSSASQSSIFVQSAGSASAATVVVKQAASQTGDLLQLQDSNGNVNGAFDTTGAQLSLGKVGASGTVSQGKIVLGDGTTDNVSLTLATGVLTGASGPLTVTLPKPTSGTTAVVCYQGDPACGFAASAGAGVNSIGALNGGTPSTNGASITGTTLYLQSASATNPGLIDTTTQTIAGDKTLSGNTTLSGSTTVAAGLNVTSGATILTGSLATKAAADYTTTGAQSDVDLGSASLVRLNGSSAQTLNSIAGGSDGRILTIVNAGTTTATITNNGTGTTGNQVITGTGADLNLPSGASISLIYDAGANVWRVTGSVATTTAAGVNSVGAVSTTSNVNGATITGTTLNLSVADGTNAGLLSATTQTIGGAKTFTSAITGNAGLNVGGGAVTLQGNTASSLTTTSGDLTLDAAGNVNIGTTTATGVTIGRSGITTTIAGNLAVTLSTTTGTGLVCQNTASALAACDSSYLAPTGTNFIQNQNSALQTGTFKINGTGTASTLQISTTGSLDTSAAGALNIGLTTGGSATSINLNQSTVVAANQTITFTGGTTANRPSSPTEGMEYYDTTTKQLLVYANGKWQGDRSTATKIVAASNASQAEKDAADYVATGTNDQTVINAALTAAAGGKVVLTEGTFTLGAAVSVPNNTTLAGAGRGTVLQLANLAGQTVNAIQNTDSTTGTGVVIRDLTVDGNKTVNTTGTMAGIYFNGVGAGSGSTARAGGQILNVLAQNFITYGVELNTSANNTVNGSVALANGTNSTSSGFYVLSSSRNTFTANTATGNTGIGIRLNGSSYDVINGNYASGNTSNGIALGSSSNNTITGNNLSDNGGTGANDTIILNSTSSYNTVTGNTIYDSAGTGYAINIPVATAIGNYVANNSYQGTGTQYFNDAGTNTVFGGQINNTGAYLIQPAGAIQLTGNTTVTGGLTQSGGAISLTGNAASTITTTAGNLSLDSAATVQIGTSTATGVTIGKTGTTTTIAGVGAITGNATVGGTLGVTGATTLSSTLNVTGLSTLAGLTNTGATILSAITISDVSAGGSVGSAATTVDVASTLNINQTTTGKTLTLPNPTTTTAGHILYVSNVGTASFSIYGITAAPGTTQDFIWNGTAWTVNGSGTTGNYIQNGTSQQTANFNIASASTGSVGAIIQGITGQTADLFEVKSITGVAFGVNSTYNPFSNSGFQINNGGLQVSGSQSSTGTNASQVLINNTGANGLPGNRGIIVRANSTQSANTLEIQDSSSNFQGGFGASGNVLTLGNSTATGTSAGSIRLSDGTSDGFYATLQGNTLTANQTVSLPNASGTLALTNDTTNFIRNQTGQQASSNFNISGTGIANILQAGTFDTNAATALNIGTTNATSINLNQNTTLAAGKTITFTGGTTANRPASPTAGMTYYDTSTNTLLTYNGSKWVSAPRAATVIVAASNASQAEKDGADYVATGSGDEATINAALTAAAGGKVVLTEGTFVLGGSVSIPNNTTLAGAGRGTLIQLSNLTGQTVYAITNTDTSTGTGVTIRDLQLDGNRTVNTTGSMDGIYFNGMGSGAGTTAKQGGFITNVWVNNFIGRGVNLNFSTGTTVSNSNLQNNQVAGIISSASKNIITGNVVQGNGNFGIYISGTGYSVISNNLIAANGASGTGTAGLYLYGAFSNNVTGNTFRDNGGTGANDSIRLNNSASNNTISNNTITDTAGTGYAINIVDSGSTGNYLSANTYSGTGATSINDAGTGTIYGGQLNGSGAFVIQPAGGIALNGATTVTGGLTQSGGAISLQGNAASSITTTAGNLSLDSAATLQLGTSTATAVSIGKSGVTTTINGPTVHTGIVSINNASPVATNQLSINTVTTANSTTNNAQLLIGTNGTGNSGIIVEQVASQGATNYGFAILNSTGSVVAGLSNAGNVIAQGGNFSTFDQTGASSNSATVNFRSGNASGTTSNSGNVNVDAGTATGTTGTANLGTTNASAVNIGRATTITTVNGALNIGSNNVFNTAGVLQNVALSGTYSNALTLNNAGNVFGGTSLTVSGAVQGGTLTSTGLTTTAGLTNTGATLLSAKAISDVSAGGNIGTAASTVDVATTFNVNQTTAGQTLSLPSPTVTTAGRIAYVSNIGTASFTIYGITAAPGTTQDFIWNGTAWTVNGSGTTGNYIQNGTSQQASSNFNISGTGVATIFQGGTFDTNAAAALQIGTTNATSINLAKNTTIAAGKNITFASGAGSFDQSASTGTFKTGTGAVSLNGETTIAYGSNLNLTAGTLNINSGAIFQTSSVNFGSLLSNNYTAGSDLINTLSANSSTNFSLRGVSNKVDTTSSSSIASEVLQGSYNTATNNGTGTIGTVNGIQALVTNGSTGGITTASGIEAGFTKGTGTITTGYNLLLDNAAGQATNAYSIYSNGGANVLKTGADGVVGLTIQGNSATQSGDLFRAVNSSNAVLAKIDASGNLTANSGTFTGNITATGSLATKKGTDYATVGTTNDVNFGATSLVRLTGASAQTITGIAGGSDGLRLTIVNAGTTTATLSNANTGSAAANRIITGTGNDVSLPAGASIELIYDAGTNVWRVTSGVAVTGGATSGVTTIGALQTTPTSANGATISGNTLTLQSASGSFAGLVDTNAQTFAGAKTFSSIITGNAGLTVAGATSLTAATGTVGLTVQGASGQDIADFRDNSGTRQAYYDSTGNLISLQTIGIGGAATGIAKLYVVTAGVGEVINVTSTNNILQLQNNGTNKVTFDSNGNQYTTANIGINNATGANPFAINTLTTAQSGYQATISTGGTTNNGLVIQGVASQSTSTSYLTVQSSAGSAFFQVAGTGTTSAYGSLGLGSTSLTSSGFFKNYTVGTGGVTTYDVVVLANDGGNARAIDSTTAYDARILGVATSTIAANSTVGIATGGTATVNYTGTAPAIGDQLVVSAVSGKVMVDNNATQGVLGYATTAGTAGTVGVRIQITSGVTNPTFQGAVTVGSLQNTNNSFNVTAAGNVTTNNITSTGTIQANGSITSGNATTAGSIIIANGNGTSSTINTLATTAQTYSLPATGGTLLTTATANTNYIQNTTTQQASSNFNISGTGVASTLQAGTFDTNAATALNIGTTNATSINLNQNTTLAAGKTITFTGGTTANRPASPTEGMEYYDTTTKQLLVYANGKWQGDRSDTTKIVAASNATQAEKDGADYVATGSGDEATINAALTAAAGGKVYLTEGTFTLGGSVSVPNNTTLAGAGRGTLLQFGNVNGQTVDAIVNSDTTTGTGVTIRDLSLDGNKATNTTGTISGIHLTNIGSSSPVRTGGLITGVWATNFPTYGVYLSTAIYTTVSNVVSQSNANHGIFLSGTSARNTITNNTVISNTGNGVTTSGGLYNVISNNVIASNAGHGLFFNASSNYNTVTGNNLRDNGTGATDSIRLTSSNNNTITGNTITDTTGTGYAINITDAASSANYLASNTYSGTGATSINDAGTGTIYGGQLNSGGAYQIQSANGIALNGATTVSGSLTQSGGAISLQGNAASSITTTAGNLSLDSAATLQLGTSTATAVSIGKAGVTTTINGPTVATGIVSINNASPAATNQLTINTITTTNTTTNSAQVLVSTNGAANSGIVVQEVAGQGAGTYGLVVQNSAGNVLAGITGAGNVVANGGLVSTFDQSSASANSTNLSLRSGNSSGANGVSGNVSLDAGSVGTGGSQGTISIGTGNASGVTIGRTATTTTVNGTGNFTGNLGVNNATAANPFAVNTLTTAQSGYQAAISTGSTTNNGVVIQGVASQSASTNLLSIQDSTGATYLSVNGAGAVQSNQGYVVGSGNVGYNKNYTAGTGGVTGQDVVVYANDGGAARVIDSTTAYDTRVAGVALTTVANNGTVSVVISGATTVRYIGTAPVIGDQLVVSATSGRVQVDNNATQGILGYAISAGSGNTVGVRLQLNGGQTNPTFQGAVTVGSLQNTNNSFNVNASGNVTANNITSTGTIQANGAITSGNATTAGSIILANGNGTSSTINTLATTAQTYSLPATGGTLLTTTAANGSYIQNNPGTQQTNSSFNIAAGSGVVAAVIQGASGQNIANFNNSAGTNVASIDQNGKITAVGAALSGVISITGPTTETVATGSTYSLHTYNLTNTNTSATQASVTAQRIALTGTANTNAAGNVLTGIAFSGVTPQANNSFTGLNFGTGYNSILSYQGATVIDGTGVLQSAGLSGTYSNQLNFSNTSNTYAGATATLSGAVQGGSFDSSSATALNIGATNATSITLGGANTATVTLNSKQFTNNGSTVFGSTTLANYASSTTLTASSTVDRYSTLIIPQTTAGITVTLPTPTATTQAGRIIYVINNGSQPFTMQGVSITAGHAQTFVYDGNSNWTPTNIDGAGSGATFVGAVDALAKTGNGGSISGNGLYFESADASNPGVVTAGTQTFGGNKTFNGTINGTSITGSGTIQGATLQNGNSSFQVTSTGIVKATLDTTAGSTLVCQNASGNLSGCTNTYETTTGNDFIQNNPASQQTGFFNVKASGSNISTITGASGQDIVDFKTNSGTTVASINQFGNFSANAGSFTSSISSSSNEVSSNITNSNISATAATTNAYNVSLTGTANTNNTNTLNGVNLQNVTAATGNVFNGIQVGTGYNNVLNVGATSIINGAGVLQSAGLAGSYTGSLQFNNAADTFGGLSATLSGAVQGGSFANTGNSFAVTSAGLVKLALDSTAGSTLVCQNASGNLSGCSTSYQAAGNYLVQAPTSTSTNTISPVTSGVTGLTVNGTTTGTAAPAEVINQTQNAAGLSINNSGTSSSLSITTTGNPAAGSALVLANNNSATPSGNLIDLQNKGTSKFSVDISGNVSAFGSISNLTGIASSGVIKFSSIGGGIVQSASDGTLSSGLLNLGSTTYISGQLPVANGGTGVGTLASNGVLYGNGTGTVQVTSAPTTGQVLLGNGSTPKFTTLGGDINTVGTTGAVTVGGVRNQNFSFASLATGDVLQYDGTNVTNGHITNTNLTAGQFTSIQGVGALTAGSITSFGTIATGNTISGTSITGTTSVLTTLLDTPTAGGTLAIGTTNATGGISLNQNVTIAAGKSITFAGTTGNFNQSASNGTFDTGTGAVNLNGAATAKAGLTINNTGSLATKAASDYTATGLQSDVNLGAASLVRLNGASAQTLSGIAGGTDGRILTIVNAGANTAVIKNGAGLAGNQVITGTTNDLSLPTGATVTLVYDAAGSVWRVSGTNAVSGGYATGNGQAILQGGNNFGGSTAATIGTINGGALNLNTNNTTKAVIDTTGNLTFQQGSVISTTTGNLTVQGSGNLILNTTSAGQVNIGTANSNQVNIGSSAAAISINGNATSGAVSIQAATGGTIAIGTTNVGPVSIGAAGSTTTVNGALTVSQLLTGSLGATVSGGAISLNDASNNNTSINGTTSAGTVTIGNTATSGLNLENGNGTGTAAANLFNGTTSHNVNIASGATGGNSNVVKIGATSAGSTTLIQGGTSATAVSVQATGTGTLSLGTTSGNIVSIGNAGTTTTANGALSVSQLLTGNAGATIGGGAIALTGNASSSLTTTTGTLNLQGAGAVTISTTNTTTSAGISIASGNSSTGTAGTVSIDTGLSNSGTSIIAIGTANAGQINIGNGTNTINLNSLTNAKAGLKVANTGSLSTAASADYTATGTLDNVNLGTGSLVRLNGASPQTINGIAGGTDGRILTIVNAGANAAILSNNASSTPANYITTGTGSAISLVSGATITLIYDANSSVWRVSGSVAAAGGYSNGVTSIGALQTSPTSANGATISGTVLSLQSASASFAGLVDTNAQTFSGAKTFSSLITGQAGIATTGGAVSLQGNAASSLTTTAGGLTIDTTTAAGQTIAIGNSAITHTIQIGTGAAVQTISIGSTFAGSTVAINGTTSLNGNTDVANTASLATKAGTTYTTPGVANSAPLNIASLYLLNTSGAAQVINGISAGRDGQRLTLTNVSTTLAVTLSNNSGSATGSKIITGTAGDVVVPAGASAELVYDATNSVWRVVSGVAATGGYIQLQGGTPGTVQTGNFNISGTGTANTFQAAGLDSPAGITNLYIGSNNTTGIYLSQSTYLSNGKSLGIRTTAPSEALTVNGNINIRDTDTPAKQLRIRTSGTGVDVESGGGNITISTYPNADLSGTQHTKVVYENTTDNTQLIRQIQFRDTSYGTLRNTIDGTVGGDNKFNQDAEATNFIVQGQSDASLLYVQGSTNRVGIGTNTPGYKLDVNGTANATILQATTYAYAPSFDTASAGALSIGNTNATSINIGKASVGTTALGGLTVNSGAASTIGLKIQGAASQSANYLNVTANGGSAGAVFNINSAGNVGIGSTSGSGVLQVERSSYTSNLLLLNNGVTGTPAAYPYSYMPTLSVRSSQTSGSRPLFLGYDNGAGTGYAGFLTSGACGNYNQICVDLGSGTTAYTALQNVGTTLQIGGGNDGNFANITLASSGTTSITNGLNVGTSNQFAVDASGNTTTSGYVRGASFDANAVAPLSIGAANATAITIGGTNTTSILMTTGSTSGYKVQAGTGGSTFQSTTDNGQALTVQNSVGANIFSVDTSNTAASSAANLSINGGSEFAYSGEWATYGGATSVTRDAAAGHFASGTAAANAVVTGANQGARNIFGNNVVTGFGYNVSFSIKSSTGTPTLSVLYYNGSTTTGCAAGSYDSTTISTGFVKYTCTFTATTTNANAYVAISQTDGTARSLYIDNLSVVQQSVGGSQNTGDIRIGGATGQGLTLLTLDKSAGVPFTGSIPSLAGSLYFDTTSNKIQCYDGSAWGACGAAPNSIISLTPEYTGAVLHGSGIGTLTSDFCSSAAGVNINDGTSSQPTICGANQTYNFYKWTSPQSGAQTYSIYVTYQLPSGFKNFISGQTSLVARTDSTNSTVAYTVYKNVGGTLSTCAGSTSVSTGSQTNWQTVAPGTDPSSCGFAAGNSIVFKIDVTASSSANAYVSNLNFQYTNQ